MSGPDPRAAPSAGLLIAYAAPALPAAMLGLPLLVFLPAYYAQATPLSLTTIGLVLLIARLWDVAIDPAIGFLSDRTRSRWGRRRPWMLASLPLVLGASYALFQPPETAGAAYLLMWMLLVYLGWSMLQIPHQAWGAELCTEYHARNRVTAWRESLTVAGVALASALPVLLPGGPGRPVEEAALQAILWATLILLPVAGVVLLATVPEPKAAMPAAWPGWREGLAALRANAPFRRLISSYLVNGVANALPATLFLLYAGDVLDAQGQEGAFLLLYFLCGLASVPFWLAYAKRTSKHRAWCHAMLIACLGFLPAPLLGAGDAMWFAVICVVTGLCFGADLALPASMQADAVDAETAETGAARTGLYFALWSVATKLALALAPALAFPLLDAAGYERASADGDGLFLLAVLYAWVPVAFKLAAVAAIWNFPLDAGAHGALRARIDARTT
ncbi:MAG: MFS transporter [Tagaea sp.]|nr:MFS transporter [Tagaea sp.]